MNLKQAEIVLEKISRLYKSMKLDERNIDAFEQDLMLSYIRQLFESFSPGKPVSKKIKPVLPPVETIVETPVEPVKAPPKPKPATPKVPKVAETPKAPEPPKVVVPDEVPQVSTKTESPRIITPPVIEETPKPAPPKPAPAPAPTATVGLSVADKSALFEFKAAKELSEKLSQAPIRDLTKAMGLNEKIFTINELFGGDSKLFDDTMKKLNTFSTFDRAADYLSAGVAHSQDWISRSRKKKALNFIQLVKRRYN